VFLLASVGCNNSQSGSGDAGGSGKTQTPAKKPGDGGLADKSESTEHSAASTNADPNAESPPNDESHPNDTADETGDKPVEIAPPPPGAFPDIALSAAHRSTCKLFIGDQLRLPALADLDGSAVELEKLFGARATVVMFWQHDDPDAVEALTDFGPLMLAPYGDRGVRAVAIHAGDAVAEVKSIAERLQLAFPMLVDADFAAFSQVTDAPRGLMPRMFLVDAGGRILWFDIEYSRTTRRDLDRALRYLTRD
jgi:peroxiredoxin